MIAALQILAAYFLVDLASGLYHLATDCGWNIRQQVEDFQDHHVTNKMDTPGFYQTVIPAVPFLLAGIYFGSVFLLAIAAFSLIVQVPHYFAHVPNPPAVIRWLQESRIIIHPEHHAAHHNDGTFGKNFCVFTGWNDWWLNRLARYMPRRES